VRISARLPARRSAPNTYNILSANLEERHATSSMSDLVNAVGRMQAPDAAY